MLKLQQTYSCSAEVTADKCADAVGSGDMAVFATPSMIALMEQAAAHCVASDLDEGMTSVGTEISVAHSKATPLGGTVRAQATLTAIDGRSLSFDIEAHDESGEIGRGTHTRFIVDRAKFLAKLQGNINKN